MTTPDPLDEALISAYSILSLLHYRGIVNSELNREDVKKALDQLEPLAKNGARAKEGGAISAEYGDGIRDAQIEVRDALKDLEGARPMLIVGFDDDIETLLGVATLYVDAFPQDQMMTLPEKLGLQQVEAILDKYGRRS